jgi:threonine/homoserine/homoserine lactone efflux protein
MLSVLLTVWLLHVAALVTPGANVLLVSHLAANGDRRAATYAALGVTVGAVAWSSAAVLGVSALFVAVPALRLALQVAGAAYLIYVACRMWLAPLPAASRIGGLSRGGALRAGLLTNLSNPKAALFFGSIFTTALPGHPSPVLLVASIAIVLVNALGWHLLLAFLFSRQAVQNGYSARRATLSRVAGSVVGTIGIYLLVSTLIELNSSSSSLR